jgi:uncharacterized protein YehS (DUF1456 family)
MLKNDILRKIIYIFDKKLQKIAFKILSYEKNEMEKKKLVLLQSNPNDSY